MNTNFFDRYFFLIVIFFGFVYSILIGEGIYGYGIDIREGYRLSNLTWGNITDRLGFKISTLTIFDKHIGIHITTFVTFVSLFLLLKTYKNFLHLNNKNLLIIVFLFIHTWPFIMGYLNGMRQVLMMSFLYLNIYLIEKKNFNFLILITITPIFFLHKTGFYFGIIILYLLFYKNFYLINKIKNNVIIFSILSSLALIVLTSFFRNIDFSTRIINWDFRAPFLFLNLSTLIYFFTFKKVEDCTILEKSIFIFSFHQIVFLLLGYNLEYERLNMITLFLNILFYSSFFKSSKRPLYLYLVCLILIFISYINGNYGSLIYIKI